VDNQRSIYQRLYRKTAAEVDSIRLDREREIELTADAVHRHILSQTRLLLDIGCGTGRFAQRFAEKGYFVVGIDISEVLLRIAVRRIPVQCASATSIPFRVSTFDVALMSLLLQQLTAMEQHNAIQEAARVLGRNGILVVRTCSHADLRRRPFNDFFPSSLSVNLARYPRISGVEDLMKKAGLEVEETVPVFSDVPVSAEDLLYATRSKHNTTLELIPNDEFERGCEKLAQSLEGKTEFVVPHYHTIVVGRKHV